MKIVLILLLYINYVICQDEKRFYVNKYPKKVKAGMQQLLNVGKYVKSDRRIPGVTNAAKYTAFIPIERGVTVNVPQSPLFPSIDIESDPKHRVKKILPDYLWTSLRSKRSVNSPKINKSVKGVRNNKKPQPAGKVSRKRNSNKKSGKRQRPAQKSGNPKVRGKPQVVRNAKKRKTHKRSRPHRQARSHGKSRGKVHTRRLISARDADIREYPYTVSIQKDRRHWCGGALLNPKLIITTANCLWKGNQISRLKVRVGSRFTDKGGELVRIDEVMRHPGWKIRKNPDNDVALALLSKRVRFSHTVHGVDLPNRMMVPPFNDVWVTSWGADRRDGIFDELSNTLQVFHTRVMHRDKCNNITQRYGVTVTDNFICFVQSGSRAPCTRDTGAPAVSDGVVWGLASWGLRKLCGTERFPAMFSYLASDSNMDFIANATHYLMSDERYNPFPDRLPRVIVSRTTPKVLTLPYK